MRWVFGPIQEQALQGPVAGEPHVTPLSDSQFVEGDLTIVNKRKNPAPVQDGTARLEVSDPAVLEATMTGTNPYHVTVKALASGAARLSFKGDADLGDGVQEIEVFEDFSVTAGPAVGGQFVFGAPQEQPEA